MAYNIDFGQKSVDNDIKRRQVALEEGRLAEQSTANFWNRVNAQEANRQRQQELNMRQEKQDNELSWNDAIKAQEVEERNARIENLRKLTSKYDQAYEADRVKNDEAKRQAEARAGMLNSELGTLFLSAYGRGGTVSPSQLKAFNAATGSQYDFLGNTMDIPMQDGSIRKEIIGDGKSFFMGQFQRDRRGDIVYGEDGTPVTQMVEMPRQMQKMLLSSAFGKDYTAGLMSGATRNGLSVDDRIDIEETKAKGRVDVERAKGENAKAIAGMNNEAKIGVAKLNAESKEKVQKLVNELKKYGIDIGLQIAEENNATKKDIAEGKNETAKTIAEGKNKTATDIATANNASHEKIASEKNETARDINTEKETGRTDRATQRQATQREKNEETARHNKETEKFNRDKLEQDTKNKEADRQSREIITLITRHLTTNVKIPGAANVLKEVQQMQKVLDGGNLTSENRAAMKQRLNEILAQYGIKYNQEGIKSGDNTSIVSRKRATGKDGKTYERIVYADGTTTVKEVK